MFRNILTAASAGAALIATSPLLAQGPGGGRGGAGIGAGAQVNSQGSMNASANGMLNANSNSALSRSTAPTTNVGTSANVNSRASVSSQGLLNASPNGISHASNNSVLARGAVSSSSLPGLTTGLTVNNSTGTSVGTVSRVITGTDGSVRAVEVTSPTGRVLRLPPTSLSISGNVVTTTSTSTGG